MSSAQPIRCHNTGNFTVKPAVLGLYATIALPVETSRMLALLVILALATVRLFRASPPFLSTTTGWYAAGLLAGLATGVVHISAMVVAPYVLARQMSAKTMRVSLIMYFCFSMLTSLVFQIGFGVLDTLAISRGRIFAPLVDVGVLLGTALFRPAMETIYKRFCLDLLILLALAGSLRLAI